MASGWRKPRRVPGRQAAARAEGRVWLDVPRQPARAVGGQADLYKANLHRGVSGGIEGDRCLRLGGSGIDVFAPVID